MKNGKYKDFYAQIRKEAGDRELIYFWINNLSPDCFRQQEDSYYCLDGECEYLGLKIQYHIVLSAELYKKLPHIRIPFPIEFRGEKEFKGIGFHIKKNAFPGLVKGKCGDVAVEIQWSGTYKRLSRYNKKAANMARYQKTIRENSERAVMRKTCSCPLFMGKETECPPAEGREHGINKRYQKTDRKGD